MINGGTVEHHCFQSVRHRSEWAMFIAMLICPRVAMKEPLGPLGFDPQQMRMQPMTLQFDVSNVDEKLG